MKLQSLSTRLDDSHDIGYRCVAFYQLRLKIAIENIWSEFSINRLIKKIAITSKSTLISQIPF